MGHKTDFRAFPGAQEIASIPTVPPVLPVEGRRIGAPRCASLITIRDTVEGLDGDLGLVDLAGHLLNVIPTYRFVDVGSACRAASCGLFDILLVSRPSSLEHLGTPGGTVLARLARSGVSVCSGYVGWLSPDNFSEPRPTAIGAIPPGDRK